MYTLVILTKARGKIVASYECGSLAMLKFKIFNMLTSHRRAVILNEDNEVQYIYELSENGVPEDVTNQYDVEVVTC